MDFHFLLDHGLLEQRVSINSLNFQIRATRPARTSSTSNEFGFQLDLRIRQFKCILTVGTGSKTSLRSSHFIIHIVRTREQDGCSGKDLEHLLLRIVLVLLQELDINFSVITDKRGANKRYRSY